jgi:hypothetical protein
MIDTITAFVMKWLDPVGVVIGLLIAIPVFWTWYEIIFGYRRRQRKWRREASQQNGVRPAILIVDLLTGKDIRTSIEHARQQHEALRDIPGDRIIYIDIQERIGIDNMPTLANKLRRACADLIAMGADTIYLFYAGPTGVATIVGAELANTARVLVYQHEKGGYTNIGPLQEES